MLNFLIKLGLTKCFLTQDAPYHLIGTICPGDYTAVLYFSTKSVKVVVNPNNGCPFYCNQLVIEHQTFKTVAVFVSNLRDFVFTSHGFLQKAKQTHTNAINLFFVFLKFEKACWYQNQYKIWQKK